MGTHLESRNQTIDEPWLADHLLRKVRRSPIQFCLLAILLLSLAARLLPGPRTIDDSYITFRYARNLLAGEGFTYNPGERVQGTTTPLYTLLMASLALFAGGQTAPFPQIALLVNAAADMLTCLLLFRLGSRLGSQRAGISAALVWAVAPFSVTFAIGGLETSLYVLLLTTTVYFHIYEKHKSAALSGALALLTRPDALILLGLLGLDRVWDVARFRRSAISEQRLGTRDQVRGTRKETQAIIYQFTGINPRSKIANRRSLTFEILAFMLPVSAWFIFAALYFGSLLPHSIAAKSLAYHLPPTAALTRLVQHFATPFLEHLTFGIPAIAVGLVLYPFLFLIGARRARRAWPHSWPFLVYPWLYFAAFAIANPLIFRWYLTPPLPAYILGILLGADQVLSNILKVRPNPPLPPSLKGRGAGELGNILVIFVVILAPVALSLRDWELHPSHGPDRPAPSMAWIELELLYRQASDVLAPRLAADPSANLLAAGDVGVLGFFTHTRILDTVGLNSPQSLEYYPLDPSYYTINYAVPPNLILDLHPDYIVLLEVYVRQGLLKDPSFQQQYSLLQKIPTDIYGSDGMLILIRRARDQVNR